jgi:tetratricopeptide (TPR) repeat protein
VTAQHEQASADITRCLDISRSVNDGFSQGIALFGLSMIEIWLGSYARGLELASEGVRLSRERRLVVPLLRCLWTQGASWVGLGDYQSALEVLREALALSEKIGDAGFLTRFLNTLGWLHIECGDRQPGLALSARGLELARQSRHATGIERMAFTLINEGDAYIADGDLAAAADVLDEAHHIVRHPPPSRWMTWRYATHCYVSLGELALARGDPDGALSFADRSLEIAVPTRSRKYESRAWRLKGEAAMARHELDDASEFLPRSLHIAADIGEPRSRWLALAATARLATARGRREEARSVYAEAADIVNRVVGQVHDVGLRAGLDGSPVIREIREQAPQ